VGEFCVFTFFGLTEVTADTTYTIWYDRGD